MLCTLMGLISELIKFHASKKLRNFRVSRGFNFAVEQITKISRGYNFAVWEQILNFEKYDYTRILFSKKTTIVS